MTLVMVATLGLSACSSLGDLTGFSTFENRIVCTVAKDEVHMLSKYGPMALGSKISEKDLSVCK